MADLETTLVGQITPRDEKNYWRLSYIRDVPVTMEWEHANMHLPSAGNSNLLCERASLPTHAECTRGAAAPIWIRPPARFLASFRASNGR